LELLSLYWGVVLCCVENAKQRTPISRGREEKKRRGEERDVMQNVISTTLGLAWEVAERAETLGHRANANQDCLQSILNALAHVRAVLKGILCDNFRFGGLF